jgi:hypothetical protein
MTQAEMEELRFSRYKLLFTPTAGQDCAVEVQFKDNVKATYIGRSV